MSYTTPTAAEFKARYPAFAAVGDALVTSVLTEAATHVSTDWTEGDYQPGIMLYAAHILTLDGQGTSSAAQLQGFRRIQMGSLSLESAASGQVGALNSTSYGVRFMTLMRRNSPGILAV